MSRADGAIASGTEKILQSKRAFFHGSEIYSDLGTGNLQESLFYDDLCKLE